MGQDELLEKLSELLDDLCWEWERMSQSGRDTYSEIQTVMTQLMQ